MSQLKTSFVKLKSITIKKVDNAYDFEVENTHRIIAKDVKSKNAFYTSNCNHPDIEEFVRVKQTYGKITKANLSVGITDDFMIAVENDDLWNLKFKGKIYKTVKAKELYNLIMDSTYNKAEPGVLFLDNMKKNNPVVYAGNSTTCNPCGEVPGFTDLTTACLLGNQNLTQYVKIDLNNKTYFDFDEYCKDLAIFVRMLDNVCDLSSLPLPSFEFFVKNFRQIGIGVNGLGSTLLMLGMSYGSNESISFIKKLFSLRENVTWQASAKLSQEKGSFTYYDKEKFSTTEYFKSNRISQETKDTILKYGVRNAKTTTCPPNGSTSMVCDNTSNGIEPIFSLDVSRKITVTKFPEGLNAENVKTILKSYKIGEAETWEGNYNGTEYYYEPHNRGLCEVKVLRDYGYQWLLDNNPESLINNKSLISVNPVDIENIERQVFKTTGKSLKFENDYKINNLVVEDHLNVLEWIQYFTNQAVSKTVNVPKDYSFEDFKNLYIKGWKLGLIGLTTYREGSMESVIEDASSPKKVEIVREIKKDIKLPKQFLNGDTKIIEKEGMKFYIHFSYLPDDVDKLHPIGIWITTNHKGEVKNANKACKKLIELVKKFEIDQDIIDNTWDKCTGDSAHNRVARMISLCMRHNIPKEEILVALNGIDGDNVSTLLSAIRKFISGTIADGVKLKNIKCPQCNSDDLVMQSGCHICLTCGYSGCM